MDHPTIQAVVLFLSVFMIFSTTDAADALGADEGKILVNHLTKNKIKYLPYTNVSIFLLVF